MNKVKERCAKDGCAKFLYSSNGMFTELKFVKIFLYILNVIPVVICFLPSSDELTKIICSCASFALTIINEVVGALLSSYKEKAILSHQLYEAEITGSSFSKAEYDRELTNELNELAIRKGLPKMRKAGSYPVSYVPAEVNDDYSYLYLCRTSAAKIRYLVSRLFYAYVTCLIAIGVTLIGVNFAQKTTGQTLYLLVCFWPLIIPIIRNCSSCRKCARQCVKICADIDNFFADGDASVERLARFYYYVQNIEFEMLLTKPVIFNFVSAMFRKRVNALMEGVTERFIEAIAELKERNLMLKGVIAQPRGKRLITKTPYDMERLLKLKKAKSKGTKPAAAETAATASSAHSPAKSEPPKRTVKSDGAKPAQKSGTAKTPQKAEAKPAAKPAAKPKTAGQKPNAPKTTKSAKTENKQNKK